MGLIETTEDNQNEALINEARILATLLEQANDLENYIEEINPSDFADEGFKVVFKNLKHYINTQGIESYNYFLFKDYLLSLNDERLKDFTTRLESFIDNFVIAFDFESYFNVFRKNNLRRALIKTNEYINKKALNFDENPSSLIEKSIELLNKVVGRYGIENNYKDAGEIAEELFNNFVKFGVEDSSEGVVIPSGFIDLDNKIKGFKSGEFVIIAARPSCGKTALAVSLMLNMLTSPIDRIIKDEIGEIAREKKKTKIAFYSLEMGARAIIKRFLSSFACVDANYINGIKKLEDNSIEDNLNKAYENLIEILKNQLFIFDKQMTINEIKSSARQIKQQQDVDIIFIDYLTRIVIDNKGNKEEWQRIGEISNALKSLANELDIPIVCLSQLNREAEDQKPKLSHLRNSGSIEQDADLIIFLHRERTKEEKEKGKDLLFNRVYYNNGTETIVCEKEKDILMSIAKNRNGEIGEFNVAFLSNFVKFANMQDCQMCEVNLE